MVERFPSDDSVAAVLRRAVGDPTSDLDSVLARGAQARRVRTRRSMAITGVAGLAAVVAVLTFVATRAQPTTVLPAGVPRHSMSAITEGTYSTRPLKNAALIRDGIRAPSLPGRSTVFSLTFHNGVYRQLQAWDGGAPHLEDHGTYSVHGSTIAFVSAYKGQRFTSSVHGTKNGFRLHATHVFCRCRNTRRVAPVILTVAAFHRR
jgi:hypothetical protein